MLLPNPIPRNPIVKLRIGSRGTQMENILNLLRREIDPHHSMLAGEVDVQGNVFICVEESPEMTGEDMSFLLDLTRAFTEGEINEGTAPEGIISEGEPLEMHLIQFSFEDQAEL